MHFGDARLTAADDHFNAKLVAGANGPAEFRPFDRSQQDDFTLSIRHRFQYQHARHLRHRFDDENTRHHREVGEMPGEEGFVGRDILDAYDAQFLEFDNAVDQQERVAVGQNVADRVNVEKSHCMNHKYNVGR